MIDETFPRQSARTRRFSLGTPRGFTISPDGQRIVFLRTRSGSDPVTCLWSFDVGEGKETLLVDPTAMGVDESDLPPEERARRERVREQAGGVVHYAADRTLNTVAVPLAGRLYLVQTDTSETRELELGEVVVDPRLDPTGGHVAYVSDGALRVVATNGGEQHTLLQPDGPKVTFGLAEFVAAEEMDRNRGYWWSPDGTAVLAARVDTGPVCRWHISDPANPDRPPVEIAYPAAGTANADVSLVLVSLDGKQIPVVWDREAFEYVVSAYWGEAALLVAVISRDQRHMQVLEVDPATGATRVRREDTDPSWIDVVEGTPDLLDDGRLVWTADSEDTKRLVIEDEVVTPPGLKVRSVLDVDGDTVLFVGQEEPTEMHVWAWSPSGLERVSGHEGVHAGRRSGGTTVLLSRTLERHGAEVTVCRAGEVVGQIESLAEKPGLTPTVRLASLGERALRSALLYPTGHVPGSGRLPVLLDPYGGPGMQRVLKAGGAYLEAQWFADQGFVVLVVDGRGVNGRGYTWERAIRGDFATPVLADQVDALHAAAAEYPDLDLDRVGIRGWSFGGFLAALAVLRRPDVFHAAVSGAPVTEHRLYDTYYMERYLGHPDEEPDNYDRCSLLGDAPNLRRPLLLIHGFADDNVVVAHTLQLSSALTAAGRPHSVLPLSGVTHMTPQEVVAENRLLMELEFLKRSLGMG
jgi:dipeptidyl-peptidase-4